MEQVMDENKGLELTAENVDLVLDEIRWGTLDSQIGGRGKGHARPARRSARRLRRQGGAACNAGVGSVS